MVDALGLGLHVAQLATHPMPESNMSREIHDMLMGKWSISTLNILLIPLLVIAM